MRKAGRGGREEGVTLAEREHLGFLAMAQGKYADALKHMTGALELDPSRSHIAVNLALCLLYTKKLKQAVQTLEAVSSHFSPLIPLPPLFPSLFSIPSLPPPLPV